MASQAPQPRPLAGRIPALLRQCAAAGMLAVAALALVVPAPGLATVRFELAAAALTQCWGEPLTAVVVGAAIHLATPEAGDPVAAAGWPLRLAGRRLPEALGWLAHARLAPWRMAVHLVALACWLGLLVPLAWVLPRGDWTDDGRMAAGAWIVAPLLVLAVLCWTVTSLGSLVWAPGWAAALLGVRSWLLRQAGGGPS